MLGYTRMADGQDPAIRKLVEMGTGYTPATT